MDARNLDGHLGEGTEVHGTLRFEGSVRIDGRFEGKVASPATLILGPTAKVEAELEVRELAVHGNLKGSVKASERITIHATGRVEADLQTGKLVIEPGAFFQGQCTMERPEGPARAAETEKGEQKAKQRVPGRPMTRPAANR